MEARRSYPRTMPLAGQISLLVCSKWAAYWGPSEGCSVACPLPAIRACPQPAELCACPCCGLATVEAHSITAACQTLEGLAV